MFFNSLHYLIFAPIVILAFFAFSRHRPMQRTLLLIASLYFYAVFEVPFLLLLLFSISITFFCARMIAASDHVAWRRIWLVSGIAANLGILYFFKFVDFSFEIYNYAFHLQAGQNWHIRPWGVILPVGISFYTLQAMAYVIDVYRKDIEPGKSLFSFALFLSFFPQLVAGPIMRAKDLLHQFSEDHPFTIENFRAGLGIMALGFFKKTFMADPAALVADQVFSNPEQYSTAGIWIGAVAFIFQIYGDFSGYSDIAIGTGRIMGFHIPRNFMRPFLADRLSDLWSRWHISLSTWLRDYVYIPMGGSRVNVLRYYFNIFITMAVSGVWHGSGLNYVIWGLYHAALVVLERMLFSLPAVERFWDRLPRIARVWYPFVIFVFSGLMFRATAIEGLSAMQTANVMMLRAILPSTGILPAISSSVLLAIAILMLVESLVEYRKTIFDKLLANNVIYYSLTGTILLYCALVYAMSDSSPFVYFQF
ncbi:MAG: MBOAT family protein [Leptospiraceae bacterium]|nr:MBOAT family protein [Leptospiraceae bacterium]